MKQLIFISIMILSSMGYAVKDTEVLFVPKGGTSAIELDYIYLKMNYALTGPPNSKLNVEGSLFNLDYMWGLDDEMSLGISTDTGSTKADFKSNSTSYKSKSEGLSDLILKFRMNESQWLFGLDSGLPLDSNKNNSNDYTSNRYSGGISLSPNIGFIFPNGNFNFGGKLYYNYYLDRKSESTTGATTTNQTISGGNSLLLTPFVEWYFGAGYLSAQYTVGSFSDTTSKTEGGSQSTQKADNSSILKLAGSYDFTNSLTGTASYNLVMFPADSDRLRPATNMTMAQIGMRFLSNSRQ